MRVALLFAYRCARFTRGKGGGVRKRKIKN